MASLLPAGLGVHHSAHGLSPYGASDILAEQPRMAATRSSWDFQHLPTGASEPRPSPRPPDSPTPIDVAARVAGVAIPTASPTVSDRDRMRLTTAQRLRDVAETHG
jgi:hypothetical protein